MRQSFKDILYQQKKWHTEISLKLIQSGKITSETLEDWQNAQMLLFDTACCGATGGTLDSSPNSELGATEISECETTKGMNSDEP